MPAPPILQINHASLHSVKLSARIAAVGPEQSHVEPVISPSLAPGMAAVVPPLGFCIMSRVVQRQLNRTGSCGRQRHTRFRYRLLVRRCRATEQQCRGTQQRERCYGTGNVEPVEHLSTVRMWARPCPTILATTNSNLPSVASERAPLAVARSSHPIGSPNLARGRRPSLSRYPRR